MEMNIVKIENEEMIRDYYLKPAFNLYCQKNIDEDYKIINGFNINEAIHELNNGCRLITSTCKESVINKDCVVDR